MADGPDDPKQKADKAWRWCERQWDRAPSPSQMVEAAVTASIEAALVEALAPVLERVARLEEENASMTVEALADAVQAVLATLKQREADGPAVTPTPCATCGGARWVCDVSVDGASYHRKPCPECSKPAAGPEGTLQHNPGLGSVTMSTEQAAALLKSSKPPASAEGELTVAQRSRRFSDTTGAIDWNYRSAELHPDRCLCQKGSTPHKHYDEPPYACARCVECKGYVPAVPNPPAPAATDFRGTIAPGTTISVDVGPGQNISPAESEGETACTRHGQAQCPACAAGMAEEAQPPSPAESEGSGQWRAGRSIGRTLYIGDKCIGMVDTPELAAAIVAAMNAPSPAESEAPKTEKCTATRRAASGILLNCTRAPHDDVLLHLSVEGWLWAPEQVAPKTEEEAGPLFNFCKKCDAFRGPDVTVCNVCGSPISKLREPPKTEEARKAVGPDAQPTEPAPPATQGIPQSGPQAPERIRLQFRGGTPFIGGTLQPALNVSDAEYVRADLLEAAERRIVDCRHEAMLEVLHEAENPSQTPIGSPGSIMSRARDIGLKAKKREHMITHDVVVARAEGREAGIREAAEVARAMRDADTGPSEYAQGARQGLRLAGGRILALLAKKPEVGT